MGNSSDYAEFLQSPLWIGLRDACKERDRWRCVVCNRKNRLEAHHKIYRGEWAETTLDDLVTLCRFCHAREHGLKLPAGPERPTKTIRPKKLKRLLKENWRLQGASLLARKTPHNARRRVLMGRMGKG